MESPVASRFFARVQQSLHDNTFVRLRLRPSGGLTTEIRLVHVRAGTALSFVVSDPRQSRTKNYPIEAGLVELSRLLPRDGSAWLETTGRGFQFVATADGRARLVVHAGTGGPSEPVRTHDRARRTHLDGAADWLTRLGLTDPAGRPLAGRRDKLRQIERYADLLAHFAADCGWKAGDRITLADMGCGKGYLTFAAWHVLRRERAIDAGVIGVDERHDLVAACATVVRDIGATDMTFLAGRIGDVALPPADALVALHACNDATDHAIVRGVRDGAKLIVVAPCCHKDVRRALGTPSPLGPLLQHGIFKERLAEWLTDGMRVLALEAAGYRVTTAEFVAAEHTPKNLLIGAVRGNTKRRRREAGAQLDAIKAWAGLGPLPLDAIKTGADDMTSARRFDPPADDEERSGMAQPT